MQCVEVMWKEQTSWNGVHLELLSSSATRPYPQTNESSPYSDTADKEKGPAPYKYLALRGWALWNFTRTHTKLTN
jgi:hypothetical protein